MLETKRLLQPLKVTFIWTWISSQRSRLQWIGFKGRGERNKEEHAHQSNATSSSSG